VACICIWMARLPSDVTPQFQRIMQQLYAIIKYCLLMDRLHAWPKMNIWGYHCLAPPPMSSLNTGSGTGSGMYTSPHGFHPPRHGATTLRHFSVGFSTSRFGGKLELGDACAATSTSTISSDSHLSVTFNLSSS